VLKHNRTEQNCVKQKLPVFMFALSVVYVKGFYVYQFHYCVHIFDVLLSTYILVCPVVAAVN
jgi:hypothetical protein